MRHLIFLLALFSTITLFAQNNAEAIEGQWLKTPKEDLVISVYKVENDYRGKVIKGKNEKKQVVGFVILERLRYNAKKHLWSGGKIHDPSSGKTYDAEATINADGMLEVQCYMGMKFLGTKKYFKRVK